MNKNTIHIFFLFILAVSISCYTTKNQKNNNKQTEKSDSLKNIQLMIDAQAQLGEGAIWHPEQQKLYWIDIEGKQLHIFDPATKNDQIHEFEQRIGTVVPARKGGVLVALQDGIYHYLPESKKLSFLAAPQGHNPEQYRFNDGKCGPQGRFWVGTMVMKAEKKTASLFCMDLDANLKKVKDSITISNGLGWSPDEKRFYYIDTPTKKVEAFDYDAKKGEISNPEFTVELNPDSLGHPDGSTMDAEGMLWIASWGGACVTRWNPETGELLQKIDVPSKNVTSCAFGGENLDILFITTAGDKEKEKYPHSGGVFAVKPGVKGIPAYFYEGIVAKE